MRFAPGASPRPTTRSRGAFLAVMALVGTVPASPAFAQEVATISTAVSSPSKQAITLARIKETVSDVRADPKNGPKQLELGRLYVRRAFETADPSFYPSAETALTKAETLLGRSPEVLDAQAALALARHQFNDAFDLASAILRQRPTSIEGRLALVDSSIELGKYDSAAIAIDELASQRPNLATLSRLSFSRQLAGDLRGAERTMRQAVGAAPTRSFDQAVAFGYLGDVLLEGGRLDAAARAYSDALRIDPTVSTAVLGQARVAMARNDPASATKLLDALIARTPQPGALGLRADIARATGDRKAALATDQLVDASVKLFEANGAVVDAELAVLLADRGPASAGAAVQTSRRAYANRRTIFTADAVAWSLFSAGKVAEALPFAREAVRRDPAVSFVRWHAATIFAAAGDFTGARTEFEAAIRNPWFSPSQRPAIEAMAKKLGLSMASETRSASNFSS